jgi:uncharacterized protein with HEPN domain
MSRDSLSLNDYLGHILEAIERIQSYVVDLDEATFLNSNMTQDAVIRNFEIIGEASNNIEKHFPHFVSRYSQIPLSVAYQMRNALAHGYFKVDFEMIWKTIYIDLPPLQDQISKARSALNNK